MAPTITDLPAELIEAVLILSAASDNPGSVAALSQTSKFFHDLIYMCPDQHLWREIFLTTFDDPRPALNHLSTISGGHPSFDAHKFDWTREYVHRISAATYLRHLPPTSKDTAPPKARPTTRSTSVLHEVPDIPSLLPVLKALLSVVNTSTLFPSSPPISLTILTNSSSEDANSPFAPMINSPSFPPLLLLLTTNYNTVLNSLNATWLHDLLETGFPPELTRMLLGNLSIDVQGRPPYHTALTPVSYWDGSEVGHLFHKLVCCTGFIPIPTPPSPLDLELSPDPEFAPADLSVPWTCPESQSASDTNKEEDRTTPLLPPPISPLQSSFYSAEEQYAAARILARRRVYDMRYLSPTRMWGPFRPVQREALSASASSTSTSSYQGKAEDEDEDDDEDEQNEDDEDEDNLRLIYGTNRRSHLNPPIAPYELVPDYVWLASARIVVEANLKEAFEQSDDPDAFSVGDILPLMRKMHTIRIGGSPGYWNERANRPGDGNEGGRGSKVSGNLNEEVEGWDWAGVGGIWKRCICWLDYRELLIHNLAPEKFVEDSTQEACRMIPMSIRITGYSKSPIPPDSAIRPLPTIHVEGESIGSDRSLRDVRKVKGTVGMIGDGAIRWSLVSSATGSSEPEWSSESVQIGGPGAAIGLLGMWTGALHERPDPLGPFWAWKVG